MDIQVLTRFFMWCTVINGAMLVLSAAMIMLAQDFVYSMHSKWFHIPRETFTVAIYSLLGFFKIIFIVFNIVPYAALLIVG